MKLTGFFCAIVVMILVALNSCTPDSDQAPPHQQFVNSLVFDTLQGKWKHVVTRFRPSPTGVITAIIYPNDSCQFNADLTGMDHFPQVPSSYTPQVQFTYNLLHDDSTLIFNTGTLINPVYDTVTIILINAGTLQYRSKPKLINYSMIHGTYIEEVLLSK